ncbi:MAG: hypothetical protein JF609_05765 [Verrucomicrobia bacterium]|nr:hypothetical protein [Verrucomicrobiota bacterium]
MNAAELIKKLDDIPKDEPHFVAALYEVLDDVKEVDDPKNFFPLAFKYMRERDDSDFGSPGPLSHFIEQYFPEYVSDLADSLKIMPTEPTLFLARRIFNSARIKRDEVSINALPILVKAMRWAKENLQLESWIIEQMDEMLSQATR